MTERVRRLRQRSLAAEPEITAERALLVTRFYRENEGTHSEPMMRALCFQALCEHKTVWIGEDELIVGERGPAPKLTPTFPELTCHSLEDLRVLGEREKTRYRAPPDVVRDYEAEVIPYWRGRTMRDRIFAHMTGEWKRAYEAGVFTEFMEQRAPGHTTLDGKVYRRGFRAFQDDIDRALSELDWFGDPEALTKSEQLRAMRVAADAAIRLSERHAERARAVAGQCADPVRRGELVRIAAVCERVPANAPRDLWEALQMYWWCHLGVITELNGWDSFNPGRLDVHLRPFYEQGTASGELDRESARELLECFWVKFNNHPAPPKVGVTAAESGTYTDFANVNLGGLLPDGGSAVCDFSYLVLEVIEEMHLLQPSNNVQISRETPDAFLDAACRVIRRGYGFPSVFNADAIVQELVRQGKSLEDARAGGASGCVEAGAFGKEAYILTGYLNLPRILEIALCRGVDPSTGLRLGPDTGDPRAWGSIEDALAAWERQLRHFVDVKVRGNQVIERLYAQYAPAPFLSLLIDDCIARGRDYNDGGARYNTAYIQGVGIGTLADSLAALEQCVFQERAVTMDRLLAALASDFAGEEALRVALASRAPKYGNDDDAADGPMRHCFDAFCAAVDGRPNTRGGTYHIDMLPTTCHIHFGSLTGALPDGRRAGMPLSEGISPVQGADRRGPTAVMRSAAKMDHLRTGGTLLNQKLLPAVVDGENGIRKMRDLIRGYFALGGHHVQFNVVDGATLREAQEKPEEHRDLIVRVAGYSDYFADLPRVLQDEIISRTEHASL